MANTVPHTGGDENSTAWGAEELARVSPNGPREMSGAYLFWARGSLATFVSGLYAFATTGTLLRCVRDSAYPGEPIWRCASSASCSLILETQSVRVSKLSALATTSATFLPHHRLTNLVHSHAGLTNDN